MYAADWHYLVVAVELYPLDADNVGVLEDRDGVQGEGVPDADVGVVTQLAGRHLLLVATDRQTAGTQTDERDQRRASLKEPSHLFRMSRTGLKWSLICLGYDKLFFAWKMCLNYEKNPI